jgi:lysozyme
MKMSKPGVQMLKSFEGLSLKAYEDVGGVWTVGFGSTGLHVIPGLEITERIADKFLYGDLRRFEEGVNILCEGVALTQNQFDALVSLAFNIGLGRLQGSTLLKKLKSGDVAGAADQFLRWNKVDGRVVRGLTERRKKEREWFLKK